MKKSSTKLLALLAAGFISAVLVEQAQAVAIVGTVKFDAAPVGSVTASGNSGAGVTTLTFANPWMVDVGPTGDYAGTTGQLANFTNFSFMGDGASASLLGGPIVPLWAFPIPAGITNYSFDLVSLLFANVTTGPGGVIHSISLIGTGVAHKTGRDDTLAIWTLSGTSTTGFTFSATSSTSAAGAAVPEGGSALALLGVALIAVEAIRRKLAAA